MNPAKFFRSAATLLLLVLTTGCSESPLPTEGQVLNPLANVSPATRTPFEGTLYGCSGTAPLEATVTPGGVLHFAGATNVNMWVSDNPLVNGIERNVVDATINLKHGIGRVHGSATITPEDIDGTWVVDFLVKIGGKFAGEANGTGYGTGELEGLRIDFAVAPVADPTVNLCTVDFPFVARLSGVITGGANTN